MRFRHFRDAALLRLLERYDAAALQAAILEAPERDVPHPNAVGLALERRREQQGAAPPVAMTLPAHVRDRDAPVRPHAPRAACQPSRSSPGGRH